MTTGGTTISPGLVFVGLGFVVFALWLGVRIGVPAIVGIIKIRWPIGKVLLALAGMWSSIGLSSLVGYLFFHYLVATGTSTDEGLVFALLLSGAMSFLVTERVEEWLMKVLVGRSEADDTPSSKPK